jgi:hypothetical protein
MKTEELIRTLATDLQPVRRLGSVERRTAIWAAFALSCAAAGAYLLGTRPDLPARLREPAYLAEAVLLLSVCALSARTALALAVPGAERSAAPGMLSVSGLLLWASLAGCDGLTGAGSAAWANGFPCIWRLVALAVLPAATLLLMLRKAAPLAPRWTGALAVLSAGSVAALGTRLICARDDVPHVLLWHCAPLIVASLGGIVLGKRILWRAPIS